MGTTNLNLSRVKRKTAPVPKPTGLPTGVYTRPNGRYQSMVSVAGKNYVIGTFSTALEASAAYQGAIRMLHRLEAASPAPWAVRVR